MDARPGQPGPGSVAPTTVSPSESTLPAGTPSSVQAGLPQPPVTVPAVSAAGVPKLPSSSSLPGPLPQATPGSLTERPPSASRTLQVEVLAPASNVKSSGERRARPSGSDQSKSVPASPQREPQQAASITVPRVASEHGGDFAGHSQSTGNSKAPAPCDTRDSTLLAPLLLAMSQRHREAFTPAAPASASVSALATGNSAPLPSGAVDSLGAPSSTDGMPRAPVGSLPPNKPCHGAGPLAAPSPSASQAASGASSIRPGPVAAAQARIGSLSHATPPVQASVGQLEASTATPTGPSRTSGAPHSTLVPAGNIQAGGVGMPSRGLGAGIAHSLPVPPDGNILRLYGGTFGTAIGSGGSGSAHVAPHGFTRAAGNAGTLGPSSGPVVSPGFGSNTPVWYPHLATAAGGLPWRTSLQTPGTFDPTHSPPSSLTAVELSPPASSASAKHSAQGVHPRPSLGGVVTAPSKRARLARSSAGHTLTPASGAALSSSGQGTIAQPAGSSVPPSSGSGVASAPAPPSQPSSVRVAASAPPLQRSEATSKRPTFSSASGIHRILGSHKNVDAAQVKPDAPGAAASQSRPGGQITSPSRSGSGGVVPARSLAIQSKVASDHPDTSPTGMIAQLSKELQTTKAALARSQQQCQTHWELLSRLSDVLIVFDMAGIVVFVSPSCLEVLGYRAEEMFKKPLALFLSEEYHEEFEARIRLMMDLQQERPLAGLEQIISCKFKRKDGASVWMEGKGQAWQHGDMVEFVMSFRELFTSDMTGGSAPWVNPTQQGLPGMGGFGGMPVGGMMPQFMGMQQHAAMYPSTFPAAMMGHIESQVDPRMDPRFMVGPSYQPFPVGFPATSMPPSGVLSAVPAQAGVPAPSAAAPYGTLTIPGSGFIPGSAASPASTAQLPSPSVQGNHPSGPAA